MGYYRHGTSELSWVYGLTQDNVDIWKELFFASVIYAYVQLTKVNQITEPKVERVFTYQKSMETLRMYNITIGVQRI